MVNMLRQLRFYSLALIFVAASSGRLANVAHAEGKPGVVKVSAQSEFRVVPDEAIITFSVSTMNDKIRTAKAENDEVTNAIADAIKAHAVAADDFKVENLESRPKYEMYRIFLGYEVTRTFEVRTSDFSKIDPIISSLVETGGNHIMIDRLKLEVRDQRKHQFEARRLAVEYAREKAAHLAELNGMKIGNALSIEEDVEYNYDAGGFGGMGGGGISSTNKPADSRIATRPTIAPPEKRPVVQLVSAQKEAIQQAVKPKETPAANQDILLSPGQVSLNATVTIEFELLPK